MSGIRHPLEPHLMRLVNLTDAQRAKLDPLKRGAGSRPLGRGS